MERVGVRELKSHLSSHLKRVRAGRPLVITERGRAIATISPIVSAAESPELEWARRMVEAGRAHWAGGKPQGAADAVALTTGATLADAVLEDRR